MKTKQILLSSIAIMMLSIIGCKKYPDGPEYSLLTKKERVANDWKIAQVYDNGKDVTSDYSKYELSLRKSGAATLSAKFVILGSNFEYVTEGTWAFVSDKAKLSFDFDNNNADKVYQILKLKEDEMWLKEDAGTLEIHYVTK